MRMTCDDCLTRYIIQRDLTEAEAQRLMSSLEESGRSICGADSSLECQEEENY